MANKWQQLLFETCEAGVSSALAPELLPPNQFAWGGNIDVRGGKPSTRPNIARRLDLPPGLIQGAEFFSVQGGMIVASIAGRMWRIRINGNSFSAEEINIGFENSSIVKQVWMTQTVETLVIQDGQSNAILYNGSTAPRAVTGQVPRGRQMAYGNGRLWVAINANEVVAGDIRTNAAGSELNFSEATYLTGGGALFFPTRTTGMAFIPLTGQSDYGALLVFGALETNSIRADITSRDDWGKIPGFVTSILRSVGAASQWGITSVNQDLYWRDSNGGIRSIRNALADEAGPGSAPVSREVSRLTDYDSQQLLPFCSSIYFDNRLLVTSSPFLLPNGGVGFKNLISLDFAPLSSMGGKSQPAYNGQWNGLNFVKLVSGFFNGKNRSFALTTDDAGNNQLWEFGTGDRADITESCTDGTADALNIEVPITCFLEYPRRDFGQSKSRKRLERCDVWLSSVDGELDLKVYWRSDNSQKWLKWDEAPTCAQTSDTSTTTPHVWKNLLPQERPQFKTFTIPDDINEVIKYSAQVGFEFQIRLVWTGRCRIHRMMTHATMLDDPDYANRDGYEITCVENDVTGNQVQYVIPTDGCANYQLALYEDEIEIPRGTRWGLGAVTTTEYTFSFCNRTGKTIYNFNVVLISGCATAFTLSQAAPRTINAGLCVEFRITYDPGVICDNPNALVSLNIGNSSIFDFTVDDGVHAQRPQVTVQPDPQTIEPGAEAVYSIEATGSTPLVYRWQVSSDGGTTWTNVEDDDNYDGATTDVLTIADTPESFDGNEYRCRVTNLYGVDYSDAADLNVSTGPTWTPFAELPPGGPGAALNTVNVYSGNYTYGTRFDSFVSSVVGDDFSNVLVVNTNDFPAGANLMQANMAFSIYFDTAGSKSINFVVALTAGSYAAGFGVNFANLYSMDGLTEYDTDFSIGNTDSSTPLTLDVPAPGQYVIWAGASRTVNTPASKFSLTAGVTLGTGDLAAQIA